MLVLGHLIDLVALLPQTPSMNQFNFREIDDIKGIAQALGCEVSFLQTVLDRPSGFYRLIRLYKRRRPEPRIVYEVDSDLSNLHKNILTSITAEVKFPECVQGFVPKRSIVTNASLHLGRKYVLNLDIKDFFDSINVGRITQVFATLGCNHTVAIIFAQLCTLNECLVQGANTSPILANLVCSDLDEQLITLGDEYGSSYSRYADDITFSGDIPPPTKKIYKCIKSYGFRLNPDKQKWQLRGRQQYVTGLTVFDKVMPRIPKKIKKQLRQALYYIDKYGLESHIEKVNDQQERGRASWIDGLIAFTYSVEPEQAYKLDIAWQAILTKEEDLLTSRRDPSKLIRKWRSSQNINHPNIASLGTQKTGGNSDASYSVDLFQ